MSSANKKKRVRPTDYKDPAGWGDSVSVSRKAKEELAENEVAPAPVTNQVNNAKNQSANLVNYQNYQPEKRPVRTNKLSQKEPTHQVSQQRNTGVSDEIKQLNQEISTALTEIESVFGRFFNQVAFEVKNLGLAIYNLFLRSFVFIFVTPVRNAGHLFATFLNDVSLYLDKFNNWLSSPASSRSTQSHRTTQNRQAVRPTGVAPIQQISNEQDPIQEMEDKYPHVFYGTVFSELAKEGIIFLNIKNENLYEPMKRRLSVEDEHKLLERGLAEIKSCARLAKNLPSPNKGRYVSQPMIEILSNAEMDDLKAFLEYVENHPRPFKERSLRLSEAFATWAHKGAPI